MQRKYFEYEVTCLLPPEQGEVVWTIKERASRKNKGTLNATLTSDQEPNVWYKYHKLCMSPETRKAIYCKFFRVRYGEDLLDISIREKRKVSQAQLNKLLHNELSEAVNKNISLESIFNEILSKVKDKESVKIIKNIAQKYDITI